MTLRNARCNDEDVGDTLWNDSEEDGDVRREREEEEDTACEDGDSDSVC